MAMSRATSAPGLPAELLERLARTWHAACRRGRTQSFQSDVVELCERYEDRGTPGGSCSSVPKHRSHDPCQHSKYGSAAQDVISIQQLPDEVMAMVLSRTLDPEHPGSLCCNSYIQDLRTDRNLRVSPLFARLRQLPLYFSRDALLRPCVHGPLPSIVVCKRWHRIVMQRDVVHVMAAGSPSGLPSSVRTLLLRLDDVADDTTSSRSSTQPVQRAEDALACLQGLKQLEELEYGHPFRSDPAENHTQQRRDGALEHLGVYAPSSLTKLTITGCNVSEAAEASIAACFGVTRNLASLCLRYVWFHGRGPVHPGTQLRGLAPSIGSLSKLVELDLTGSKVWHIKDLRAGLSALTSLQSISLHDSYWEALQDVHLKDLASYLATLTGLRVLDFGSFSFQVEKEALAKMMLEIIALTALHTPKLDLQTESYEWAAAVFHAIPSMPAMRHLDLTSPRPMDDGSIDFDYDGSLVFEDAFAPLPLESLRLWGSAVLAFRDAPRPHLSLWPALTRLELGDCSLRDTGLLAKDVLVGLSEVQELMLFVSDTQTDLHLFALHASCLRALRYFSLTESMFDLGPSCDVLVRVLRSLSRLEVLDLYVDIETFSCHEMAELTRALATMQSLQVLQLCGVNISQPSVHVLGPFLQSCTGLTFLDLDYVRDCGNTGICDCGVLVLAAYLTDEERLDVFGAGMHDELRALWKQLRTTGRFHAL